MPIEPDKFKRDSRSPRELASAILQHEFTPGCEDFPGKTFREQLLDNAEDGNPQAQRLFSPLNALANGVSLDLRHQRGLTRALQVIAAYREDSRQLRDIAAMHANPDLLPKNDNQEVARRAHTVHGRPPPEEQRA